MSRTAVLVIASLGWIRCSSYLQNVFMIFMIFMIFHELSWCVIFHDLSFFLLLLSSSLFFSLLPTSSNFFQLLPTSTYFFSLLFCFKRKGRVQEFPVPLPRFRVQHVALSDRTTVAVEILLVIQSMSRFNFHRAAPPVGSWDHGLDHAIHRQAVGNAQHSWMHFLNFGRLLRFLQFRLVFRCTAGYGWLQLATAG